MKILKEEKGSITLFVLISMLFFVTFLVGMYILSANSESSKIAETTRIKEIYEEGVDNIDDVYESLIAKSVNKPDISGFNKEQTYYVSWDLSSSPYEINEVNMSTGLEPANWYNYTEGVNKWANIKTTGGGNDCYWVWIPRYAYKITYTDPDDRGKGGTIDVVFLKDKTNKDINGNDVTSSSYVDPKGNTGAYIVHPAFTTVGNGEAITNSDGSVNTNYVGNGGFGELTGIWVAKFEASSNSKTIYENPTTGQLAITGGVASVDVDAEGNQLTDTDLKVRVKPNVTSWRNITVGNTFTVCKNLTKPDNSLCGINNTENTNIDAHMMKNTEWGACVYLSRSVYGKNGEVWNNPYYNNVANYSPITGLCGNKPKYTTYNDANTYKYNTVDGGNASTTGNVYGVYDMAGGAWEYVAGILSSYKSMSGNYDFSNSTTYPNKYFDWYAVNYDANANKYGDAVYETSSSDGSHTGSWDSSDSYFPDSSYPVFAHGGRASNGKYAGVFAFNDVAGGAEISLTFRPVVLSSRP